MISFPIESFWIEEHGNPLFARNRFERVSTTLFLILDINSYLFESQSKKQRIGERARESTKEREWVRVRERERERERERVEVENSKWNMRGLRSNVEFRSRANTFQRRFPPPPTPPFAFIFFPQDLFFFFSPILPWESCCPKRNRYLLITKTQLRLEFDFQMDWKKPPLSCYNKRFF